MCAGEGFLELFWTCFEICYHCTVVQNTEMAMILL